MYWDISLHIDNGRDAGPLANPAHYLILVGLYGTLLAGALDDGAVARERPSDAAVHLGGGWWAPAGGLMIAACGAFALTGFPLDDLWHRLFGQDVTLWGPTHLMLIGGGSLATLGGDGADHRGDGDARPRPRARATPLRAHGCGARSSWAASSSRSPPSRASSTSACRSSGWSCTRC